MEEVLGLDCLFTLVGLKYRSVIGLEGLAKKSAFNMCLQI